MSQVTPAMLRNKRSALEALLGSHATVAVWVDSRRQRVVVPSHLQKADLVLELGYDLPIPIADIYISDDGWSGTLSFSGEPFFCFIPWEAVYIVLGVGSGEGAVWPEDVPAEIDKKLFSPRKEEEKPEESPSSKKLPAGWKVIDGGG